MSYDSEKGFAQQEVKQNIGRGSFIRTKHEGRNDYRDTEAKASQRLGKGEGPTEREIQMIKDEYEPEIRSKVSKTVTREDVIREIYEREF